MVSQFKFKLIRIVKTGFCTADFIFRNVHNANIFLDYYEICNLKKENNGISFIIFTRSIIKKAVVIDWDISISKFINAIDNKEKIIAINRMTKRKYNAEDNTYKGKY